MSGRHKYVLGVVLILGWIPLAYSLFASWPPSQVPYYLALGDEMKRQVQKFDNQTGGSAVAAEMREYFAQIERWKVRPDELEGLLWRRWALDLAQTLLGLAAGVLLLAQRRVWTVFGVVASAWYLFEHHLTPIYGIFIRDTSSLYEVANRVAVMAKHPGTFASVLHYDLLLPLICLWTLVFAVLRLVSGHRARANAT